MKVFVAGPTGAVGRQLLPQLVAAGHDVVGMVRRRETSDLVRSLGGRPVVADALDAEAVAAAVAAEEPEAIVHMATALAGGVDPRHFDRDFAVTNRLRTTGTDHLLAAAARSGVRRVVAQSYAGWPYARVDGAVKTEDDPLDPDPPAPFRATLAAIRHLEEAVTGAAWTEGVVLRFGALYGPGHEPRHGPARRARRAHPPAPLPGRRATAAACGPSCRSRTPRRQRWPPWRTGAAASTTSSTTSPRRSPTGCRRSPGPSAASRRATSRAGSGAWRRGRAERS